MEKREVERERLQRQQSAMQHEGPTQWSLAQAVSNQATGGSIAVVQDINRPLPKKGDVDSLRKFLLRNERNYCAAVLEQRL